VLILKEAKGNSEGKIAQAKLLYDIITTRKGAYSAVIEALKKTVQTGSLDLLEQQEQEPENNSLELVPYVPQEESCSTSSKVLALPAPPQHNSNLDDVYTHLRLKWEEDQETMAKVRWIPSSSASLRISDLFPAGRETSLPTYVARAFHEGEWIPGKCLMGEGGIYRAYVSYYGKEYEYMGFQVLVSPPGATGWVTTTLSKNIPRRAVIGDLIRLQ